MTPEDEEFQRISREIKRRSEEDDDIQEYKKPWVGLTEEECEEIKKNHYWNVPHIHNLFAAIERKLKEKNF